MVFPNNFMKKHCDLEHLNECLTCRKYNRCWISTKEQLKEVIDEMKEKQKNK